MGKKRRINRRRRDSPRSTPVPDLAGLRDPASLAKLPEAEQEAGRKLWADVEALLKKAQETKK
jgi:hypothetical protein